MKTLFTAAVLFLMQFSFAQSKKETGTFTTVNVFDRISVELIPADANVITITGNRHEEVEIINKNGDLHIRMPLKKLLKGEEINVKLYYMELHAVDASEGSFVSSSQPIEQAMLSLTAKEGSEIKLDVVVDKLNVKSVTGATVTLSGKSKYQEVSLGTGGILKAKDLKTVQTSLSITTGGQADVNASDIVDVKIKAGGDVTVYGNPKKIDEKITLGGTVNRAAE